MAALGWREPAADVIAGVGRAWTVAVVRCWVPRHIRSLTGAAVRRMQDASHRGRCHNVRYCRLAEELGSAVDQVDGLEWSGTAMPDTTAAYAAELDGAGQGDGDLSAPRGEPQRP